MRVRDGSEVVMVRDVREVMRIEEGLSWVHCSNRYRCILCVRC